MHINNIFPWIHFTPLIAGYVWAPMYLLVGALLACVVGFPAFVESLPLIKNRSHGAMYGLFLGLVGITVGLREFVVGLLFLFSPHTLTLRGPGPYEITATLCLLAFLLWFTVLRYVKNLPRAFIVIKNRFFMVPMVALAVAWLTSNLTKFYDAVHIGKSRYHLSDDWVISHILVLTTVIVVIFLILSCITIHAQFKAQEKTGVWDAAGCVLSMIFCFISFTFLRVTEGLGVGTWFPATSLLVLDYFVAIAALGFLITYLFVYVKGVIEGRKNGRRVTNI